MRSTPILAQGTAEHTVEAIASWGGLIAEAAGIAVILLGALAATGLFLARLRRTAGFHANFVNYRRHLGRAILLGLEFLVAADIIGTVLIELNLRTLGVLAVLVLVRTFLSFTLTVEIEGRWPWQRENETAGPVAPQAAASRPQR